MRKGGLAMKQKWVMPERNVSLEVSVTSQAALFAVATGPYIFVRVGPHMQHQYSSCYEPAKLLL